jgi:hypothetical protein
MKTITLPLGFGGEEFQLSWANPGVLSIGQQLEMASEFADALAKATTALAYTRIGNNLSPASVPNVGGKE